MCCKPTSLPRCGSLRNVIPGRGVVPSGVFEALDYQTQRTNGVPNGRAQECAVDCDGITLAMSCFSRSAGAGAVCCGLADRTTAPGYCLSNTVSAAVCTSFALDIT
jgi:hypothetical protein